MGFLKEQWEKYRDRKTKAGIVLDFVFLALFLAMLNPTTRKVISSSVIRYTMTAPKVEKKINSLADVDYNWRYQDKDGIAINFSENKGKVVLLNFWATWCPPCVAEMPSLQKLYDEYGDRVEFVLITNEGFNMINPFMTKRGLSLPVYTAIDPVSDILQSKSIPVTYLISKKGEIILSKTGAAKWHSDKVKQVIDNLLVE
ncbi:TlpA family protein disulfide reductase [Saccharicrinis aurantiacus]|uniref:TlpA family protein disulfide reductase n=1 Tax=Saccharicrinis aurantiacus TaxID=1849719 RepID=UPI0008383847|nr:TlpA family protein disulfide reductase [Saccharicrinis aurantiacus]